MKQQNDHRNDCVWSILQITKNPRKFEKKIFWNIIEGIFPIQNAQLELNYKEKSKTRVAGMLKGNLSANSALPEMSTV